MEQFLNEYWTNGTFNMNAFKASLSEFLIGGAVKILVILIVLAIGTRLIKSFTKYLRKILAKTSMDQSIHNYIISGCKVGMYFVLVITLMSIIGIPTAPFVALIGSMGVGLSLALKENLSNVAGGLTVLLLKPFKAGDYIETSGHAGTVLEIGLYHTLLKTFDNKEVMIPNGNIANNSAVNHTAYAQRRLDIEIGVAYNCDIKQVRGLLLDLTKQHDTIATDPKASVVLSQFDDSAITFTLRCWVNTDAYWDVKFALMDAIKVAFDREGIEIPYPQLDVHMK